eukprot:3437777-Rhodomonas_salina.1
MDEEERTEYVKIRKREFDLMEKRLKQKDEELTQVQSHLNEPSYVACSFQVSFTACVELLRVLHSSRACCVCALHPRCVRECGCACELLSRSFLTLVLYLLSDPRGFDLLSDPRGFDLLSEPDGLSTV